MPQPKITGHTEITDSTRKTALKAFFNIAEKWELSNAEMINLLGQPAESTFYNWKKGTIRTVAFDTIQRVSFILGIFKALKILYGTDEQGNTWIRKPNAAFNGQSALDRMLGGQVTDLAAVRGYLDVARGGW